MARGITIDVSLSAKEFKLVRAQVKHGGYASERDVIRESLRQTFDLRKTPVAPPAKQRSSASRLAAAYRASAAQDRKLASEWSTLNDAWPSI